MSTKTVKAELPTKTKNGFLFLLKTIFIHCDTVDFSYGLCYNYKNTI